MQPIKRPRYGSPDSTPEPLDHPNGHYQEFELQSYHDTQARLRSSNLHAVGVGADAQSAPGILSGLSVVGAVGAAAITIEPGVAIDGKRQVVALSEPQSLALDPSENSGKTMYVTIRYAEVINDSPTDAGNFPRPSTFDFGTIESTPVVGLHDAADGVHDDGSLIMLAIVKLKNNGMGLELLFSRDANVQRRVAGQTTSELRITNAPINDDIIEETTAGSVGTSADGNLCLASQSGKIDLDGSVDVKGNATVKRDLTCEGTIRGSLAEDMVGSTQIVNGSVKTGELANSSVTAEKVAADAIGTSQLQNDAVTAAKIKDGQVGTDELANSSVTSDKIRDGNVGTAELANNAVTAGKIKNGQVGTDELANGSVTSKKIGNGSVTSKKIARKATISLQCHDFKIGGFRRPTPGRAIVDAYSGINNKRLIINFNNDWQNGVMIFGASHASSRAYKRDISPLSFEKSLKLLNELSPVEFAYLREERKTPHLGFIAEETPDEVSTENKDAIHVDHIVALLTSVVQNQQASIDALSKRAEELERKLANS